MGLSGPRKRAKISHDPNNTQWSRSTTKFGQKILESQGWKPGDFLGANSVSRAIHYGAANASHIRITMKDNNLGLGAKQGRSREEGLTTGLDMFQDVLGRLNGKSEAQLATEQKSRTQLRGSNFVQQRWGILDFVSGGFLVGDESQVPSKVSTSDEFSSERATNAQDCAKSQPRAKDEKVCSNTMKRTKHKKSRRDFVLQDHESDEALDVQQPSNQDQTWTGGRVGFRQDKARRKAEKAARQLRREAKRDKRDAMLSKDRAAYNLSTPRTIGDLSRSNVERREGPQTASVQATILPVIGGNRQAVRQRYIQQKKLSMMDSKALNEILMIKA